MDYRAALKAKGPLTDEELPLGETALLLAGLAHPGRNLEPYFHHLKKLAEDVGARYSALVEAGADEDGQTKIAALKHVMCDQYGYDGDQETYNDLRNADLIEVIERRKGLPITLVLLAVEIGRAQGWDVKGINFPGHFLLRLDEGTQRLISDPFNQFRILQAPDLRQLAKSVLGANAELSSSHYQDATHRDILLRLQNNIKFRQIESEHYADALETVLIMRDFAPQEYRLLLDDSVLKARLGRVEEAIDVVRDYLKVVTNPKDRQDAELLLYTLERGH